MKSTLIGLLVIATATSVVFAQQRSFYAQRPVGIPEMLDQYKPKADPNVATRVGGAQQEEEEDKGPLRPAEGTIGDPYLTPRLADWPREHAPFWYINSQHIMKHRGQQAPAKTPVATPPEVQPPVEVEEPVEVPRPAKVQRPIKGPRPIPAERPAEDEEPIEVEEPVEVPRPAKVQRPIKGPRPVPAERPAKFERPDEGETGEGEEQRRPQPTGGRKVRPHQGWFPKNQQHW